MVVLPACLGRSLPPSGDSVLLSQVGTSLHSTKGCSFLDEVHSWKSLQALLLFNNSIFNIKTAKNYGGGNSSFLSIFDAEKAEVDL